MAAALAAAAAWGAWASQRERALAAQTLRLVAGGVGLSLLAGVPLAVLLARTDLPGRRALAAVLAVLLVLPLYVQTAAWQAGFGLAGWLTSSGWGPPLLDGMRGAIWVHAAAAVPWIVLIAGAGLRRVEPELEEQALLDAAPPKVLARVTLVRAAPALGAAALWVAVLIAGEMTVSDQFQVRTYAEELYTGMMLGDDAAVAGLATLPSALATAALVLAALATIARLAPWQRRPWTARPLVFRLGRWRWPSAIAAHAAVLVLAAVPLGNLLYKAGVSTTVVDQSWQTAWSPLKALRSTLLDAPRKFRAEIGWSLLVSALAAAAATLLGLALAWSARRGGIRALPAALVTAAALAVPGPLVGLAIVMLMTGADWSWLAHLYDHTIAAVWLAQTLRALPLATLVLWYALTTLPEPWLELARLEGASSFALWRRVVLPERRSAVALAFLAALVVALGELSASVLTEPPGVSTLAIRVAQLIHFGVDDQLAGICLLLTAVYGLLVLTVACCALRRRGAWRAT